MADITYETLLQRLGLPYTGTGCNAIVDLSQLGGTFNVNNLTATDCQALLQCIIDNGTPAQLVELLQRFDFTQLTNAQCIAIISQVISQDVNNAIVVGADGKLYVNVTGVDIPTLDFTQLTAAQCVDIFQCIIDNATATQLTQFLQKLDFSQLTNAQCNALVIEIISSDVNNALSIGTDGKLYATVGTVTVSLLDFTQLTSAQCIDIFQCIIANGTAQQFIDFLRKLDFSQLTSAQCEDIMACLIQNTTPAQWTQVVNNLDFTDLTQQQCQDVFDCLLTNGTTQQFIDLLQLFDLSNLTSAQCLDIASCLADNPQAIAILQQALQLGGASITSIDLAATGNPNEYTVTITWVDADGNTQTTTDGTPVTIQSTGSVNFNTLTPAECQAILDCLNNNGTPTQFTTFINNIDWTTLTEANCQAIAQCVIENMTVVQQIQLLQSFDFTQLTDAQCDALAATMISTQADNALVIGADGKLHVTVGSVTIATLDFTSLTASQCTTIFQCLLDNGTPAQFTELLQKFDLSQLTDTQCDVLAGVLLSSDADNVLQQGTDGKLHVPAPEKTVAVGCAELIASGSALQAVQDPNSPEIWSFANGAVINLGAGVNVTGLDQFGILFNEPNGSNTQTLSFPYEVSQLAISFNDLDSPVEFVTNFQADGNPVTPTVGAGIVDNAGQYSNTANNGSGELVFNFDEPITELTWDITIPAGVRFVAADVLGAKAQTYTCQAADGSETVRYRHDDSPVPAGSEVLCDIDVSQLPPEALVDRFATVTTPNLGSITTTNGVTVANGEFYIAFPDGTTWASGASGSAVTLSDNTLADYEAPDPAVSIDTRQTSALSLREVLRVHNETATEVGVGADGTNQPNSVIIGNDVGTGSTGTNNVMIGAGSTGDSAQHTFSVVMGTGAGRETLGGGPYNFYMHGNSGRNSFVNNSMMIGLGAGRNTGTVAEPVGNLLAIGNSAGRDSTGNNNNFFGFNSGNRAVGAGDNFGAGTNTLRNSSASNSVAIGADVGNGSSATQFIAIGAQAGALANNTVSIGHNSGQSTGAAEGNVAIGAAALSGGDQSGFTSAAVGFRAGRNSTGGAAAFLGAEAGDGAEGFGHVSIGSAAGQGATGQSSIGIGRLANAGSDGANIYNIGQGAGQNATGFDVYGFGRGANNGGSGSRVIALGTFAGANNTQSQRFILGHLELPRFANAAAAATDLPPAPANTSTAPGSVYVYWDQSDNTLKVRPA